VRWGLPKDKMLLDSDSSKREDYIGIANQEWDQA